MSKFKESQYERQISLMNTDVFSGDSGNGYFMGKSRAFVLKNGMNNLYEPIRQDVLKYFADNGIAWWRGSQPTGHTLSSQMACLNHLFAIRHDRDAVLAILNGIRDEFEDVLPIPCDAEPSYIAFEVVSNEDHLNEGTSTRGANCTSVDAFIYAKHRLDHKIWLIPIEWKYTESYENQDKSSEDRVNEPKGSNGKGNERLSRYTDFINVSTQLKSLPEYRYSVYYQEPFYQLMRQTLWAENILKNHEVEKLKADDYLHVHVIPKANHDLLNKTYKVSGKTMEETWRSMLSDQSKYLIVDPQDLMKPIFNLYSELTEYLRLRYW